MKLTSLPLLHLKGTVLKPSNLLYDQINFSLFVIVVSKHGLGNMGLGFHKLPNSTHFSYLLPAYSLFWGDLAWGPGEWKGNVRGTLERMTAII